MKISPPLRARQDWCGQSVSLTRMSLCALATSPLIEKVAPWSVGGRLEPRLNLGSPQIVVIVGFGTWVPGLVEPGF